MSAFAAALDTLAADPNFGEDATYVPKVGASFPVRVVWGPRANTDYQPFQVGASVPAYRATARLSELAAPQEGDVLQAGGAVFFVRKFEYDAERVSWQLDLDRRT